MSSRRRTRRSFAFWKKEIIIKFASKNNIHVLCKRRKKYIQMERKMIEICKRRRLIASSIF